MAPDIRQMPSSTCGCCDCLTDRPPARYGYRPPQDRCHGPWRVRYRSADGRQRFKQFANRPDAAAYAAQLPQEVATGGA